MVGGSLRLLPPLKLVAMNDIAEILLKVPLNIKNQINQPIKTTLFRIIYKLVLTFTICSQIEFQSM